jgi:hypothetical protein
VTTGVESARSEWEEAYRRLEEARRDPGAARGLDVQLGIVTDELRKRVGATFTVAELADEYRRADDWTRSALSESGSFPGSLASVSLVEGAAFHLYSRGAVDYEP